MRKKLELKIGMNTQHMKKLNYYSTGGITMAK